MVRSGVVDFLATLSRLIVALLVGARAATVAVALHLVVLLVHIGAILFVDRLPRVFVLILIGLVTTVAAVVLLLWFVLLLLLMVVLLVGRRRRWLMVRVLCMALSAAAAVVIAAIVVGCLVIGVGVWWVVVMRPIAGGHRFGHQLRKLSLTYGQRLVVDSSYNTKGDQQTIKAKVYKQHLPGW